MCLFFILCLLFLTFIVRVIFLYYGEETYAQIYSQIYQKRESPNSKGGFRHKRARKINFPTVSENF